MLQANSGCESSSGQGMEEASKRFQPGSWTKSRAKKEVILEAQKDKKKVLFATFDTCHLKNAEIETTFQKYKGRVVLCGDIVKDGSGSVVFTKQGSFVCVSNDSSKSNGCPCKTTRLWTTS